jgi:hypothetical protein
VDLTGAAFSCAAIQKGAIATPAASTVRNKIDKTPCPILFAFLTKRVGNHRIRVVFAKNFK